MRIKLQLNGKTVGYLAASSEKDIDLNSAKARLPDIEFDSVSLLDEEAYDKKQAEIIAAAEKAANDYANSDKGKQEIAAATQNSAFTRLIGAFTVEGSYPNKQKAMTDAIASLPDTATADELYSEAVKQLA